MCTPIKCKVLSSRKGLINILVFQHAARYLSNQEWVKSDSLKTVENTAVTAFSINYLINFCQ